MSESVELVSQRTLVSLIANGSIKSVSAVESANGRFAIQAQAKSKQGGTVTLRSHREDVRTFASLDTLRRYCRDQLGVARFEVIGQLAG